MSVERDIRYELLARLCPNSTGMIVVKIKIRNQVLLSAADLELSKLLPNLTMESLNY